MSEEMNDVASQLDALEQARRRLSQSVAASAASLQHVLPNEDAFQETSGEDLESWPRPIKRRSRANPRRWIFICVGLVAVLGLTMWRFSRPARPVPGRVHIAAASAPAVSTP